MDLSEIFNDPRAKTKLAEAERCIHIARQSAVRDWEAYDRHITPPAGDEYDRGRRDATRLLFDGYAELVFEREPDTQTFVEFLPKIQQRVGVDLQVEYDGEDPAHKGKRIARIDLQEAELCRLELVEAAWKSHASLVQRIRRYFRRGGVHRQRPGSGAVSIVTNSPERNGEQACAAETVSEPEPAAVQSPVAPVNHVDLLESVLEKRKDTTKKRWFEDQGFGGSTGLDWQKRYREGGPKRATDKGGRDEEIEAAIEKEAVKLGLIARTRSGAQTKL